MTAIGKVPALGLAADLQSGMAKRQDKGFQVQVERFLADLFLHV